MTTPDRNIDEAAPTSIDADVVKKKRRGRAPRGHDTVDRGHVIQLAPTHNLGNALARACGVHRFTYNWCLAEWIDQYEMGKKPTASDIKRQFNAIKEERWPWIMESPRDANSEAFADLGRAFSNFFESRKGTRKGKKIGFPKFRKRGERDHFYVANDKVKVRQVGKRGVVRLPVIGDVKMMEPLRWQGKILRARVFRRADKWFIAFNCEVPRAQTIKSIEGPRYPIVGIDLGLRTAVMPSHGEPRVAPRPLKADLKRLRREQRKLARRKKGSRNYNKQKRKVARRHLRVANVRKDWWHQHTTKICRENQTVVIEDFGCAFMLKNRRLSRSASDAALGMFRPLMEYKALAYETNLIIAAWNYPSTQRCARCGNIKRGADRLGRGAKDRVYVCEKCGHRDERDHNSAVNLEQYPGLEGNWDLPVPNVHGDRVLYSATTSPPSKLIGEVETKP